MKPVILNRDTHRDLRVNTRLGAEFHDNVQLVPVIAAELQTLMVDMPIYLMKDSETGAFGLFALLGFEPSENLLLGSDGWLANYVPLHMRRQPFMVGRASGVDVGAQSLISLDMDSPRLQTSEGEALFTKDGEQTPYLEDIIGLLSSMMAGVQATKGFIDAMLDLDLVEPVSISVKLANSDPRTLNGLYSLNEQAVQNLSADQLLALNSKGYLQAAYLLLGSGANMQKLINLKNNTKK
ncbi:MAG: SapC family protein [Asticcacaulis sp.]